MSIEADHTYLYTNNGQIDPGTLHDATRETRERYDFEYAADKASYFQRLEGYIRHPFRSVPFVHAKREGDSRSTVVMVHAPWATPVVPSNTAEEFGEFVTNPNASRPNELDSNRATRIIQADFLHHVLQEAGVTDEEGNYLSVVAWPSPSLDRRGIGGELGEGRRGKITRLQALGGVAVEFLDHADFGKVHLSGVSQGSAVNAEILSSGALGIDIPSSLHGETPVGRFVPLFAKNYFTDPPADWQLGGPLPRIEIARGDGKNKEGYNWANVHGNGNLLMNFMLGVEMSRINIDKLLHAARATGTKLTIERGAQSKVSAGTEEVLDNSPHASVLRNHGMLQFLRSDGFAPHSHTENVVGVVDMTLRSILFSQRRVSKIAQGS